jgi:hypothetical protein
MELNKDVQIEILEEVKRKLQSLDERNCLCELIIIGLQKKLEKSLFYADINKYIPLFTYENAVKHANANEKQGGIDIHFWWSYWRGFDYENRVKFIDWMLNELKK